MSGVGMNCRLFGSIASDLQVSSFILAAHLSRFPTRPALPRGHRH